ncbi:hypothetical protein GIB67_032301 [Kingdonia uniflora]|uniref:Uncharacterized protein n=1 Tax=Kingdonia uniflora TaxID=39325 RepID=A0A7J7MXL4_9MAGN|nr:hypothetical protein GIB67_032301 [Kingdonia uniflora]
MITITSFTIANNYGDYIRSGWRAILDCILRLHTLGLIPARVANDVADDSDIFVESWPGIYEHISNIYQSTLMPCALVEKAVFKLLRICQRLLPYKENLADELFRSLHLVLKHNDRVHLSPTNYVLCVDASRQFVESRHGQAEWSFHALDLKAGSISCLSRRSHETKGCRNK